MYKAKNMQSFLNLPTRIECKFLKFCYFIIALIFISCGNTNTTKNNVESVSVSISENEQVETNTKKTILCFGDSLTAGMGLEDSNDAFPGLLQKKIDSLSLEYVVINSGLSGETTAGGKSRVKWVLKKNVDIFLLELGANDGLRGVPLKETRANLQAIIDIVHHKNPKTNIILAGMQLPPNMGQDYTSEFRNIFADLAKKNNLKLIPFILENVGGIPELNQSDGIHPTVQGHKIVANTVWKVLETTL